MILLVWMLDELNSPAKNMNNMISGNMFAGAASFLDDFRAASQEAMTHVLRGVENSSSKGSKLSSACIARGYRHAIHHWRHLRMSEEAAQILQTTPQSHLGACVSRPSHEADGVRSFLELYYGRTTPARILTGERVFGEADVLRICVAPAILY